MRGDGGEGVDITGQAAELLAARFVLFVAFVQPDGTPYATRGWGLTVLCHRPAQLRLVLAANDLPELAGGSGRHKVAMIAGDPRTLRAVQLKGWAGPPKPATEQDQAAVDRYREGFFSAIGDADRTDRRLLELLVPADFVACTVEVEELFDQSPGPGAGAALGAAKP